MAGKAVTLEKALSDYLRYRLSVNAAYIASHEMENARDWILTNKRKQYTIDTISRAWRSLRESGKVRAREERVPGSREMTWKIIEVGTNSPHRLRLD